MTRKQLALMTLLIIPGILSMPYVSKQLSFIPILMCLIGGFAFGRLLSKK